MNDTLTIKKERIINADIKNVWTVLTNPNDIKKWLGVDAKSEWRPKSDILFSFTWDGKNYVDKGRIIHFEQEKVFSFSYWSGFSGLPDLPENYSKVEFSIELNDNITLLKLKHSDFSTETMYQHSDKNWEESLDEIKKLSEEKKKNRQE